MVSASLKNFKRRCLLKIELFQSFIERIKENKFEFRLTPNNSSARFDFELSKKVGYIESFHILNQANFQNRMAVFSQKWTVFIVFEKNIKKASTEFDMCILQDLQPVKNPNVNKKLHKLIPNVIRNLEIELQRHQDKYNNKNQESRDPALKALRTEINKENTLKKEKNRNKRKYELCQQLIKQKLLENEQDREEIENEIFEIVENNASEILKEQSDVGTRKTKEEKQLQKKKKFEDELKLIEENKKNTILFLGTAYLEDSFDTFSNNQENILNSNFQFNKKMKLFNHSYIPYILNAIEREF